MWIHIFWPLDFTDPQIRDVSAHVFLLVIANFSGLDVSNLQFLSFSFWLFLSHFWPSYQCNFKQIKTSRSIESIDNCLANAYGDNKLSTINNAWVNEVDVRQQKRCIRKSTFTFGQIRIHAFSSIFLNLRWLRYDWSLPVLSMAGWQGKTPTFLDDSENFALAKVKFSTIPSLVCWINLFFG